MLTMGLFDSIKLLKKLRMAHRPFVGDQRLLKNMNRLALLRLLRGEPGISRAEMAVQTGLTRSTVSVLIKELIDEGWLEEDSAHVTGQPGRRPTPVRLSGSRIMLVGADLSPDAICVVTTSIRMEILQTSIEPLRSRDPQAACRQLVEMVQAHAGRVANEGSRLLGIGVGLHGAVDMRTGLLQLAPNMGWRNVEVGKLLRAELALAGLGTVPVYFHNEAALAAIGETESSRRPVDDPLVYVSCGVGVGAGIVLNEGLFTGATGSAGEIGHTVLTMGGRPCSCGRLGCAEAYIGLRAIASEIGALTAGMVDHADLRRRMAARDPIARAAFSRAGELLGVLLQDVWTTFNPMTIVLGGETVALGGDVLMDAACAVLLDISSKVGLPAPIVRRARFAERAAAVGGAAFVLHATLNPQQPAFHTLPAPEMQA